MNRKLNLDTDVYCIHTVKEKNMDKNCNHDFDPKPTIDEWEWSMWQCTKCKGKLYCELWD